MKRAALIVVALVLFALAFMAAGALAGATDKKPEPPGQGPCSHGNSNKPCKDDPQPDHGKDCEEHGHKNGGVNEDHCKGGGTTDPDPTTPDPTTPDPTTPEETTPSTPDTTTPNPSVPAEPVVPPTVDPPDSPDSPSTSSPVDEPTFEEQIEEQLEEQASSNGAGTTSQTTSSTSPTHATDELPYTGLPLWAYVLIGLGLVGTGLALRRRSGAGV